MRLFLIAFLFSVCLPALAEDTQTDIAFTEGRYSDAETFALKKQTADAFAFAALSRLAEYVSEDAHPVEHLDHAEVYARAALDQDPKNVEGQLQLAICLSLRARTMEIREIRQTGYGKDARALAEAVLDADPENAWAHGFLAIWHIEVRRRGGRLGAAFMGASLSDAEKHYEEAVRLQPEDLSFPWQYGRALLALNADRYDDKGRRLLKLAVDMRAKTALQQKLQQRAQHLLDLLGTAELEAEEIELISAELL